MYQSWLTCIKPIYVPRAIVVCILSMPSFIQYSKEYIKKKKYILLDLY